jgi:hypothetical protein
MIAQTLVQLPRLRLLLAPRDTRMAIIRFWLRLLRAAMRGTGVGCECSRVFGEGDSEAIFNDRVNVTP